MKKLIIAAGLLFAFGFNSQAQLGGLINKAKGGSSSTSSNSLSKKDQENLKSAIKESQATQKAIEEKLKKPDWKNEAYVKDLKSETTKLNNSTGRIQLLDPAYDISSFKKTEIDTKKKIDLETGVIKPFTPAVNNTTKQEEPKGYVRIWDKSSKYYVNNEGFTNKFHEQNSGKILFSDKEIKREHTDPAYFKTSFDNNSVGIYSRVYLPTSVCNYAVYKNGDSTTKADYNRDPFFKMYLYADGKLLVQTDKNGIETKSLDKDLTTFFSVIVHKLENRPKKQWNHVLDSINSLKPGLHKMRLELIGVANTNSSEYKTAEPMAVGEFDLNILPGKKFKYGKKWSDIKAGMTNEALTAKAISVANAKAKEDDWKEKFSKAKITSTEWDVKVNIASVPVERTIEIELYAVFPGGYCRTVNMTFIQYYVNGSYGPLKYYSIGSYSDIDCD